jgi:hypothetical protein
MVRPLAPTMCVWANSTLVTWTGADAGVGVGVVVGVVVGVGVCGVVCAGAGVSSGAGVNVAGGVGAVTAPDAGAVLFAPLLSPPPPHAPKASSVDRVSAVRKVPDAGEGVLSILLMGWSGSPVNQLEKMPGCRTAVSQPPELSVKGKLLFLNTICNNGGAG